MTCPNCLAYGYHLPWCGALLTRFRLTIWSAYPALAAVCAAALTVTFACLSWWPLAAWMAVAVRVACVVGGG